MEDLCDIYCRKVGRCYSMLFGESSYFWLLRYSVEIFFFFGIRTLWYVIFYIRVSLGLGAYIKAGMVIGNWVFHFSSYICSSFSLSPPLLLCPFSPPSPSLLYRIPGLHSVILCSLFPVGFCISHKIFLFQSCNICHLEFS